MWHEFLHWNISAVVQNQYFLLRNSIGSCLDTHLYLISCLQANFGAAFKDTRPWGILNAAIRVAEAAGNSLQVIANFQRHPKTSNESYSKFGCELCRDMPPYERPTGCQYMDAQASCLSCGDRYCPEHYTEHHAICNPEITGDIKVHDQAFIKRAEKAAAPKTCFYDLKGGCRGNQPPHYGQFETCDSCRVLQKKHRDKRINPVKRQRTAAEKPKAKEAKLKRTNDLAAFQESEDLLRADTAANHEWFVCNKVGCPLKRNPHSGPFKTCLLCRTKEANMPSNTNKKRKAARNASAYQASKKRKLEAPIQGQTKLNFG